MSIKTKKGQSVIEVIIAVSLFVILASGSITVILGALLTSRLGEEEAAATFYANEGMEAVEAIDDTSGLPDGTYGLTYSSGVWDLAGSPDIMGKFTRRVEIHMAERDLNGDLAASGTPDPYTKKVEVYVNWSFTPLSNSEVLLTKYFTDWQTSFDPSQMP